MNNIKAAVQTNTSFNSEFISEDEIDVRELFRVIWKGKFIIAFAILIFAFAAVIYGINQPNIYKSEVLLAPVEQEGSTGLASLAGQFGGLAGLAGVNLSANGSNKSQMAIEVLKSRQFTSAFIQKHNILPQLMAADSWDMQANKIVYDDKVFNSQKKEWIREVKAPFQPEPSMQEAYKVFSKMLSVSKDKETGMVTISVQHISPYVSQQWVSWLVEDINQAMKEREVAEARKSTEFLQKQLKRTEIADIREVLYKLIEEQTKTIMFAEVRDEYVFKTIDAALVPEEKFKPKRALISILGAILGGVVGVFIVLLSYFLRLL